MLCVTAWSSCALVLDLVTFQLASRFFLFLFDYIASLLVSVFTALCVVAWSFCPLVLDLYCFSARSVAFFVSVRLPGVFFGLGVDGVVRRCLVVLCIRSGFFVTSQLALWLFSFNYRRFI